MNDQENQIFPQFSKTQQNFRVLQTPDSESNLRQKATSSKYSAYTTSKKKLSQIHSDLAELEFKFNNFQNNLNMFMNCDNRSSEFGSKNGENRFSGDNLAQGNEVLFDLNMFEAEPIYEIHKTQEQSFLPQTQPKPLAISGNQPQIQTISNDDTFQQMQSRIIPTKMHPTQYQSHLQKLKEKENQKPTQKSKIKKSKIDKTYAVRNFPMEYFDNVELLFQIMNRKKNRVKQMRSENKVAKSKERRTFDLDKEKSSKKKGNKKYVRMHSEERQIDEAKFIPCELPSQQKDFIQSNLNQPLSLFDSDRKISKATVIRKGQDGKIISLKPKLDSNNKAFIPVQKCFLDKQNQLKSPQIKTQRNFYSRSPDTLITSNQKRNSNSKQNGQFHSRKLTTNTNNQRVEGNYDQKNQIEFDQSQNLWSYPHKDFANGKGLKRHNMQYVERIMQTKTADELTKRKNYMLSSNIEGPSSFQPITPSTTIRNTGASPQVNEQKQFKTSELDQTGIFSGQNFNFFVNQKQNSPQKRYEYKEEQSFLRKINQNHARKPKYCSCCADDNQLGVIQNFTEDNTEKQTKSKPSSKKQTEDRSQEKPKIQVQSQKPKCFCNNLSPQAAQVSDRLFRKKPSGQILQRTHSHNAVKVNQYFNQSQEKQSLMTKQRNFKSHKLLKTKSSSNVLMMKSPQKHVVEHRKIESSGGFNQVNNNRSVSENKKKIEEKNNIQIKKPLLQQNHTQQPKQSRLINVSSTSRSNLMQKKSGSNVAKDNLSRKLQKKSNFASESTQKQKTEQKSRFDDGQTQEKKQIQKSVSKENINNKQESHSVIELQQKLEKNDQTQVGVDKCKTLITKRLENSGEEQASRGGVSDVLNQKQCKVIQQIEQKQQKNETTNKPRHSTQRSTFNPQAYNSEKQPQISKLQEQSQQNLNQKPSKTESHALQQEKQQQQIPIYENFNHLKNQTLSNHDQANDIDDDECFVDDKLCQNLNVKQLSDCQDQQEEDQHEGSEELFDLDQQVRGYEGVDQLVQHQKDDVFNRQEQDMDEMDEVQLQPIQSNRSDSVQLINIDESQRRQLLNEPGDIDHKSQTISPLNKPVGQVQQTINYLSHLYDSIGKEHGHKKSQSLKNKITLQQQPKITTTSVTQKSKLNSKPQQSQSSKLPINKTAPVQTKNPTLKQGPIQQQPIKSSLLKQNMKKKTNKIKAKNQIPVVNSTSLETHIKSDFNDKNKRNIEQTQHQKDNEIIKISQLDNSEQKVLQKIYDNNAGVKQLKEVLRETQQSNQDPLVSKRQFLKVLVKNDDNDQDDKQIHEKVEKERRSFTKQEKHNQNTNKIEGNVIDEKMNEKQKSRDHCSQSLSQVISPIVKPLKTTNENESNQQIKTMPKNIDPAIQPQKIHEQPTEPLITSSLNEQKEDKKTQGMNLTKLSTQQKKKHIKPPPINSESPKQQPTQILKQSQQPQQQLDQCQNQSQLHLQKQQQIDESVFELNSEQKTIRIDKHESNLFDNGSKDILGEMLEQQNMAKTRKWFDEGNCITSRKDTNKIEQLIDDDGKQEKVVNHSNDVKNFKKQEQQEVLYENQSEENSQAYHESLDNQLIIKNKEQLQKQSNKPQSVIQSQQSQVVRQRSEHLKSNQQENKEVLQHQPKKNNSSIKIVQQDPELSKNIAHNVEFEEKDIPNKKNEQLDRIQEQVLVQRDNGRKQEIGQDQTSQQQIQTSHQKQTLQTHPNNLLQNQNNPTQSLTQQPFPHNPLQPQQQHNPSPTPPPNPISQPTIIIHEQQSICSQQQLPSSIEDPNINKVQDTIISNDLIEQNRKQGKILQVVNSQEMEGYQMGRIERQVMVLGQIQGQGQRGSDRRKEEVDGRGKLQEGNKVQCIPSINQIGGENYEQQPHQPHQPQPRPPTLNPITPVLTSSHHLHPSSQSPKQQSSVTSLRQEQQKGSPVISSKEMSGSSIQKKASNNTTSNRLYSEQSIININVGLSEDQEEHDVNEGKQHVSVKASQAKDNMQTDQIVQKTQHVLPQDHPSSLSPKLLTFNHYQPNQLSQIRQVSEHQLNQDQQQTQLLQINNTPSFPSISFAKPSWKSNFFKQDQHQEQEKSDLVEQNNNSIQSPIGSEDLIRANLAKIYDNLTSEGISLAKINDIKGSEIRQNAQHQNQLPTQYSEIHIIPNKTQETSPDIIPVQITNKSFKQHNQISRQQSQQSLRQSNSKQISKSSVQQISQLPEEQPIDNCSPAVSKNNKSGQQHSQQIQQKQAIKNQAPKLSQTDFVPSKQVRSSFQSKSNKIVSIKLVQIQEHRKEEMKENAEIISSDSEVFFNNAKSSDIRQDGINDNSEEKAYSIHQKEKQVYTEPKPTQILEKTNLETQSKQNQPQHLKSKQPISQKSSLTQNNLPSSNQQKPKPSNQILTQQVFTQFNSTETSMFPTVSQTRRQSAIQVNAQEDKLYDTEPTSFKNKKSFESKISMKKYILPSKSKFVSGKMGKQGAGALKRQQEQEQSLQHSKKSKSSDKDHNKPLSQQQKTNPKQSESIKSPTLQQQPQTPNEQDQPKHSHKPSKKQQCPQCSQNQAEHYHHHMSQFMNPFMMNPFMMNPYLNQMKMFEKLEKNYRRGKRLNNSLDEDQEDSSSEQKVEQRTRNKKYKQRSSRRESNGKKSELKSQRIQQSEEDSQDDRFYSQQQQQLQFSDTQQFPNKTSPNSRLIRNPKSSPQTQPDQLSQRQSQESIPQQTQRTKLSKNNFMTSKAEIVNYIKNFELKPIMSIKVTEEMMASSRLAKQFKLALKLLGFIDPQHSFVKRLFQVSSEGKTKLWLFPNQSQFKQESTFQPVNVIASQVPKTFKEMSIVINCTLQKMFEKFQYKQSNLVKQMLQCVTGSTLFNIKPSSFNKLKNLHKHDNIRGFTFEKSKHQIYEIVGSQEISQDLNSKRREKSKESQKQKQKIVVLRKCIKDQKQDLMQNLNLTNEHKNKQETTINVKWQQFQTNFTHSLIGVFTPNYNIRGLHFINPKSQKHQQKKTFIFTMSLKSSSRQRQHCLINVNLFGSSNNKLMDTTQSNFANRTQQTQEKASSKGRLLVYHEKNSHENNYKYIGSGDLTFISMKVKDGNYLVVLQFGKKTLQNMSQGKVIVNYSGKSITLKQDKWTSDYASMMAAQNTEFIKTNQI